ncbi:MAG: VRR-NUC domain-containing protein [Massilia sp.]
MSKVLDNPFYYLDNFQRVLEWIAERYPDLLSDAERGFIDAFSGLPQPARALLIRMVMRKGTLFRASKLNYAEIGCPQEAARALLPTGWIARDPHVTLEQMFELLSKPEIAAAFDLSRHGKGARKPEQLAALRSLFSDARPFSAWYRDSADCLFQITIKPLCDRLRLIFFGNLRQDWTEFVLSDLGVYKYEQVDFAPASRGFRHRRDVDHYLALHACSERLHGAAPVDELLRELPAPAPGNEWLASRRERLVFQIAQLAEKQHDWARAYALYAGCRAAGARVRAIRVLEKDQQIRAAFALLCEAERAPESDAERQHLLRIAPRLRRRLGHPPPGKRRPVAPQRLDLRLPLPAAERWVEGAVRDHLARPEAPVYYVENALINSLFGLLCWRAIFSAIPGAFFHPFHRAPVDLQNADFVPRRADLFAACLAELDDGAYLATIRANYAAKRDLQSPFVHWEVLSEELLDMALACIPAAHLKKMCERILHDIQANRTGFPDLIQFWPNEARYNMIEVKGPGDRLQDNQLRWIDYCATHGMPVSVCYLQWQEPPA